LAFGVWATLFYWYPPDPPTHDASYQQGHPWPPG
jgi:hypothetical protein